MFLRLVIQTKLKQLCKEMLSWCIQKGQFFERYILYIYVREVNKKRDTKMMNATNPFANYTLAITAQYEETRRAVEAAEKKPARKIYRSMDSMLEECVFLGSTMFGTNFIA